MKRHGDAYYQVGETNLERLYTARFQLCNIPKKAKLKFNKKISGFQGFRGGRDKPMEHRGHLEQ